jgi:hypothetical protein
VSFGIIEAADTEELTEMLARADAALLQAKRAGRNRSVVHDSQGDVISFEPTPPAAKRNGGRKTRMSRTSPQAGTTLVPLPRLPDAPTVGILDSQA